MRLAGLHVAQVAGLAVLLLCVVAAFTGLSDLLADRLIVPERIEAADAIVVLSGGIEDSRTLSPASLRRTIQGIRLYRRGLAPTIVFSGGKAGQDAEEAEVMAALAIELGVPNTAIWVERRSNDTWTQTLEVARLAQPKGIRRILLVTDRLHMLRARTAFERAGFEVLAASDLTESSGARAPEARLLLMRQILQETFASLYYWLRERV